MNKQELIVLTDKYKREGLCFKEIKNRLEYLMFEMKLNKLKKEKVFIEDLFKQHFKELKDGQFRI
jgi:hypothetical protein